MGKIRLVGLSVPTIVTIALGMCLGAAWASAAAAQADDNRPWDLSIRGFLEYNDNVALDPDDQLGSSEEGGLAPGVSVAGRYRFLDDRMWTAGVGLNVFDKRQVDPDVDEFSATSFAPSLFAEHRRRFGKTPAQFRVQYRFRHDLVDEESFETRHSLSGNARFRVQPRLVVGPTVGIDFKDFDDDGNAEDITSRDAVRPRVGVSATYRFGARLPTVRGSYNFSHNAADGDNFDFNSHSVRVTVTQPVTIPFPHGAREIPIPIFVRGEVGYGDTDYFNFVGERDRQQEDLTLKGLVFMPLGQKLSADLSYTYNNNNSNLSQFDTIRNTVALGVTYRF